MCAYLRASDGFEVSLVEVRRGVYERRGLTKRKSSVLVEHVSLRSGSGVVVRSPAAVAAPDPASWRRQRWLASSGFDSVQGLSGSGSAMEGPLLCLACVRGSAQTGLRHLDACGAWIGTKSPTEGCLSLSKPMGADDRCVLLQNKFT